MCLWQCLNDYGSFFKLNLLIPRTKRSWSWWWTSRMEFNRYQLLSDLVKIFKKNQGWWSDWHKVLWNLFLSCDNSTDDLFFFSNKGSNSIQSGATEATRAWEARSVNWISPQCVINSNHLLCCFGSSSYGSFGICQ